MIAAIARVLVFLAIGEGICSLFDLMLPGPILGLALLFAWFALNRRVDPETGRLFDGAVGHLQLLFVPAVAGVVARPDLIATGWLPIAAAVLLGTAGTLALTAVAGAALLRLFGKGREASSA